MKLRKPKKSLLVKNTIIGSAIFAGLLVLFISRNDPFAVQNAFFATGLLFVLFTLFHIARGTGFYDLISYGVNRIMRSFKSANKQDEYERESYYEYVSARDHSFSIEPLMTGAAFCAISMVLRLFS